MKNMIKGVLYDPYKSEPPKVAVIEEEYQKLREAIGCRCFDITTRKFGKHVCDVVCDDEGLLIDNPIPVIFESSGVYIAGGVFITGTADSDGYLTSLTDEQCNDILGLFTKKHLFTAEGIRPVWAIRAAYEWEDYNA